MKPVLPDATCVHLENLNNALWELKHMASILDTMIDHYFSLSSASKNEYGQYIFSLSGDTRNELLFAVSDTRRRTFEAHADMPKALEMLE